MSDSAALLEALLGELDSLAEEIVAAGRAAIPSFAAVPYAEHLAATREAIELLVRGSLSEGGDSLDPSRLAELGSRRAEQGVPVGDLLRAWRLSMRLATERSRAIAGELGISPQVVIDAFQRALETVDAATETLARGHRDVSAPSDARSPRDELILGALAGRLPVAALRVGIAENGLDVGRRYRAVLARGSRRDLEHLAHLLSDSEGRRAGMFALDGERLAGFSCAEPRRSGDARVAVGPALALESLSASERVARRIEAAIDRFGLEGVHDLAGAGLYVAAIESGDVGLALRGRYVDPIRDAGEGGEDLLASVRAWLEAGMRVAPAAERLHVHENTLRYRLNRYTEQSGADLGVSEDVVAVWFALHSAEASPD